MSKDTAPSNEDLKKQIEQGLIEKEKVMGDFNNELDQLLVRFRKERGYDIRFYVGCNSSDLAICVRLQATPVIDTTVQKDKAIPVEKAE